MKFRLYGKYAKKDYIVFFLFLTISISIITYFAGGFYIMWHIPYESTMAYEIDESEFIPANYSRMSEMANLFNFYILNKFLVFDKWDLNYMTLDSFKKLNS